MARCLAAGDENGREMDDEFHTGLNIIHLMCIFDQQQMLEWVASQSSELLRPCPPVPYSLLAAWHGASSPLHLLRRLGLLSVERDVQARTSLHVAAYRGHSSVLTQLLSWHSHLLEERDSMGRTPLFLATAASHLPCLAILLNHGADANARDLELATPLHRATSRTVIETLLANGADPTLEMVPPTTKPKASVLRHYLNHLPVEIVTLMTNFVTTSGGALTSQDLEVALDLTPWQAEMLEEETEVLMQIADGEDEAVKHPLCEVFIHLKDAFLGRKFRLLGLFLYCSYLISFTGLVLMSHSQWLQEAVLQSWKSPIHSATLIASIVSCAILVIREILLGFLFWRNLFREFSIIAGIVLQILSIAYIVLTFIFWKEKSSFPGSNHNSRQLGAATVVLAWLHLTNILGRSPGLGIYVLMVHRVARDVVAFLLIYSLTLVAFALGFHLLLESPAHRTPLASFLATLAMMYGELDFATHFSDDVIVHHGVTEVLFVLFLLFVGIIIMNLLIGLSVSNIRKIFEGSGVTRLRLTVKHVSTLKQNRPKNYNIELIIFQLHLLEQVFDKLSFLPSLKKRASLLEHLTRLQGKREKPSAIILYLFPNRKERAVWIRDSGGILQKTSFSLPPWIMANLLQLLGTREGRKKEEARREGMEREGREMAAIKREVKAARREIQALAELVKSVKIKE